MGLRIGKRNNPEQDGSNAGEIHPPPEVWMRGRPELLKAKKYIVCIRADAFPCKILIATSKQNSLRCLPVFACLARPGKCLTAT